jgi:putative FmdB family regulatory protein
MQPPPLLWVSIALFSSEGTMPIYEYHCEACDERFDRLLWSISQAPAEVTCPACQSADVRRLISAPIVHSAGESGAGAEGEEAPTPKPPVLGRKELNEALKAKGQRSG